MPSPNVPQFNILASWGAVLDAICEIIVLSKDPSPAPDKVGRAAAPVYAGTLIPHFPPLLLSPPSGSGVGGEAGAVVPPSLSVAGYSG